MVDSSPLPERLVRFCGADCTNCDAYKRFLAGDDSGLMNPETRYRCCWLPTSYPQGIDCPIRVCSEEKGILFCGECAQFDECSRMAEFYAPSGYDRLRSRMLQEVARRR